jgi:predicted permease
MDRGGKGGWVRPNGPREDVDRDVADEVSFHLDMRIRENLERGLSPEDARAEAERRFGLTSDVKARMTRIARGRRRTGSGRDWAADLWLAIRTLRRRPTFAVATILTLSLGIGAATAVFSVANRVLLRSVPAVRDPGSLVTVTVGTQGDPEAVFAVTHPSYERLRDAATSLDGLAASQQTDANVRLPASELPRRMPIEYVTLDFGEILGLEPATGRLFMPDDRNAPHVAMIGHSLWVRHFRRAPDALGATLSINGVDFIVVGVAPVGFHGTNLLSDTELWVPAEAHDVVLRWAGPAALEGGASIWTAFVGRLRPGASLADAEAQLREAATQVGADRSGGLPGDALAVVKPGIGLSTWEREQLSGIVRVLAGAVALLLLLACANAANLLLARHADRREELAVRRTLGAGRGRTVRLLVAEAALITGLAGVVGIAVATGAVRLFRGERFLTFMPPLTGIELDGRVLLFALGVSILTGVVFGVVPSLMATSELGTALRSGGRSVARSGPSRTLVAVQAAISLTLVVGSGLLFDTMLALGDLELGFRPSGVLEASLDPGSQAYDEPRRAVFFQELLDRAGAQPGIEVAGLSWAPVHGRFRSMGSIRPEGASPDDPRALRASWGHVSPGFIASIGLRLVDGRDFRRDEMFTEGRRVVLVSESAARALFPTGAAVGRTVDIGRAAPSPAEIVGIIGDARLVGGVKEPAGPLVLEPLGQAWNPQWVTIYARGAGGTTPEPGVLHRLVADMDAGLPLYDVQPVTRRIAASFTVERILVRLTSIFAAVALILAAVGLHGLLAMTVHQRLREIGIRLALGARPDHLRAMVVRQGVGVVAVGLGVGLVVASQAVRLIESRLWGVRPWDPFILIGAISVMLGTALIACWGPAMRATRVNPVDALSGD